MRNKASYVLFALIIFSVISCKKNLGPVKTGVNPDVYVAGNVVAANGNRVAAYWKNGTLSILADSSYASIANYITIAGTDVYITGWVTRASGVVEAACWKNGQRYYLTYGDTGLTGSSANSVAVDGSNVYVAGTANLKSIQFAVLWVNGAITYLGPGAGASYANNQSTWTTGLAVNGGNVYVTGEVQNPASPSYTATYWLNGTAKSLADPFFLTNVSGIIFKGNDMYMSGTVTTNGVNSPAYWENGKLNTITGLGNALSISVDNNNIYLGGTIINSSNNAEQAIYWKNGVATLVGGAATLSYVSAISAYDNNVGMAGAFGGHPASYWLNGSFVTLTGNSAACSGIVLAPKP